MSNPAAGTAPFNPDDPENDKLYTTDEVAELFSVTPETVRDWILQHKLAGVKVGKRWRVRRRELIRFGSTQY